MDIIPTTEPFRTYPITHTLKIWPIYFTAVYLGKKNFEIRKNDRNYKVGDWLSLHEWDPEKEEFTGASVEKRIGYMTSFGLQDGYVCLGLE